MIFGELKRDDPEGIAAMSQMAEEIIREHFDPIIGKAQNDYMIGKFQSEKAIQEQLLHDYRYYFVSRGREMLGFLAYYPRGKALYLSKFYLYRQYRGRGLAREMLDFVADAARREGFSCIELNVNRNNSAIQAYEAMGFRLIREEKNDIGNGFWMDDFVYRLTV